MYYNNLGCIHHQMKKHNLAALYFKKAMNVNEECIQKPNDSGTYKDMHINKTICVILILILQVTLIIWQQFKP